MLPNPKGRSALQSIRAESARNSFVSIQFDSVRFRFGTDPFKFRSDRTEFASTETADASVCAIKN